MLCPRNLEEAGFKIGLIQEIWNVRVDKEAVPLADARYYSDDIFILVNLRNIGVVNMKRPVSLVRHHGLDMGSSGMQVALHDWAVYGQYPQVVFRSR